MLEHGRTQFRILFLVACIVILLSVVFSVPANVPEADADAAWYNASWQYRRKFTLIAGGPTAVATTTTVGAANFPTLISLSNTDLTGKMNDGCTDIVFTQSDGTTKLNHEVDSCVKSSGEFNAWVNTAMSSTTNTDIYMYYGGYGNQQNATSTWEEQYDGVWHMSQDPSITTDGPCRGPTFNVCDSTTNRNHATSTGAMTATDQINALVGGGIDFDGTDDKLGVTDRVGLDLLDPGGRKTISFFIKDSSVSTDQAILTKTNQINLTGSSYGIRWDDGTTGKIEGYLDNDGTTSNGTLNDGAWHQFVHRLDVVANSQVSFVDGAIQIDTAGANPAGSGNVNEIVSFGSDSDGSSFSSSLLDEIRIENIARDAMDIQTMYQNISATTTFYTVGAEEGRRTKVRLR